VSGFIVPDAESAAAAVKNIGKIDRRKCRQYFEKRFTSTRMAEDYLAIYERLLKGQSAPIAHPERPLSWTKSAYVSNITLLPNPRLPTIERGCSSTAECLPFSIAMVTSSRSECVSVAPRIKG